MNTAKYLSALERAVYRFHQLSSPTFEQVHEVMDEMCAVLELGKVEVELFENELAEHRGISETRLFYDSGKSAEHYSVTERIAAPDETIIVYHVYPMEGAAEWTEDDKTRVRTTIAMISAFNGKSRLAQMVYHLTFHESDLDMFNVKQFMKCVRILCKMGQIDRYAAIRFNLKHFSIVNQNIGRENGTLVMKMFINALTNLYDNEYELVCRLGGDNFVALLLSDKLPAFLKMLGGTVIEFDETNDERVMVSATAGVYVIKDKGINPDDIIDRAIIAAQLAKNSSETDVIFFDDKLLARSRQYREISANFPKALKDREFLVYYQPKVAIDGRHIAGAEALCRWMHNGKLVPPGDFIPILEQGRDICKLDFYMLDAVCKDIRRWIDSGKKVVRVSVNLSRRHLSDPDLLEHIIEIIDRNQVPHQYIEIELTETTTDVEFSALKHTIGGLQKAGISTSVDDFGIGYSSLNLIKDIPWNVLKLDKSLLPTQNDENPAQKSVLFRYIISMAQEMGLECISEGVETEEQVRLLAENHCNLAQGFYFDKPLPVEEFEKRLDINYVYG